MPIDELDLILKKDPVITTFPAPSLRSDPASVEQFYATHAKTHVPLGDTDRYVDTIFKWVGGTNNGAFIGAVAGNYGEGKTSFMVHVWAHSLEHRIFTVPPFEWVRFSDLPDAVAGWLHYVLEKTHPTLARTAEHLYAQFKEKSLDEVARDVAARTRQPIEAVIATLKATNEQGTAIDTTISASRFLDYCAAITDVVKEAGYAGLLILLDEPEVAARKLGSQTVAHFLFDLADQLRIRDGDYGVFVSMPENFLADASRRFAALTARLQSRSCFPRLKDMYGHDFARTLWDRYVTEFGLGEEGVRVVSPMALEAIGQLGSSERSDLSYGPRTVVSAFSRMVFRYRQTGATYQPEDFVQDCLDYEIMIHPDYPSRVLTVLESPEVTDSNRGAVKCLAAFPDGLTIEHAKVIGIEAPLLELSRRGALVYKTAFTFGLNRLRRTGDNLEVDPFRNAVLEVADEFAPSRKTFLDAKEAFVRQFIPILFPPRRGLLGWDMQQNWIAYHSGATIAGFVGAFPQTQHQFPKRAIVVLVTSADDPTVGTIPMPDLAANGGVQSYDALVHFKLRWHSESGASGTKLEVKPGDPSRDKLATIIISIDLQGTVVPQDILSELVDQDQQTPLWILNLLQKMESQTLPREHDAQWQALRKIIIRDLTPVFLPEELGAQASAQLAQPVLDSGHDLIGSIFQKILLKRYPDYSTLVHQPQWVDKVNDYIRSLNSTEVPLACKRGREPWKADGDLASRVLGTNRMNLTGGAFQGFENLLAISSASRNAPIEIQFRVHPFEQKIVDLITEGRTGSDGKLQIDGMDCWWLPAEQVGRVAQVSGYAPDEFDKIVEIGTSRGSYSLGEHRRAKILYCRPIDVDQMRRQLRDKLSVLEQEVAEFGQVPDFVFRIDLEAIGQMIDAICDDTDYDRVATRIARHFEELHQRLPGYFDRLGENLRASRRVAKEIGDQLSGSREISTLRSIPSGKSPWCSALGRYVVGNLRRVTDELRTEAATLVTKLDQSIGRFVFQGAGRASQNIALLLEGNSAAIDAEAKATKLKEGFQNAIARLRDYEEWLKLLRRSDEIYEELVRLQAEPAHQKTADECLQDMETLSRDIADHLELRNVLGLPSHRQFATRIEEVDEKRKQYLGLLRADFERCKARLNDFIAALTIDRRVDQTFNPEVGTKCYDNLYEQGTQYVREAAIGRAKTEVDDQRRELTYTCDILSRISQEEVGPPLERLSIAAKELAQLEQTVTREWLRNAIDCSVVEETSAIVTAISNAFAAAREARQIVSRVSQPRTPDTDQSRLMLGLVPEAGTTDLKALVLQMTASLTDPGRALDESLESLADLFRCNCIRITVERRKV